MRDGLPPRVDPEENRRPPVDKDGDLDNDFYDGEDEDDFYDDEDDYDEDEDDED